MSKSERGGFGAARRPTEEKSEVLRGVCGKRFFFVSVSGGCRSQSGAWQFKQQVTVRLGEFGSLANEPTLIKALDDATRGDVRFLDCVELPDLRLVDLGVAQKRKVLRVLGQLSGQVSAKNAQTVLPPALPVCNWLEEMPQQVETDENFKRFCDKVAAHFSVDCKQLKLYAVANKKFCGSYTKITEENWRTWLSHIVAAELPLLMYAGWDPAYKYDSSGQPESPRSKPRYFESQR
jgi:hypothetical protein